MFEHVRSDATSPWLRASSFPSSAAYSAPPVPPPPPLSLIAQRYIDITREIDATQQGTSKSWLNVQSCVMHSIRSLLTIGVQQEQRLQAVEEQLCEMKQVLSILLADRQSKEERYQIDRACHEQALSAVEETVKQLDRAVSAGAACPGGVGTSGPAGQHAHLKNVYGVDRSSPSRDRGLAAEVAELRGRLDAMEGCSSSSSFLPGPERRRRSRQRRAVRESRRRECHDDDYDSVARDCDDASDDDAHRSVTAAMVREIGLLRRQWERFSKRAGTTAGATTSAGRSQREAEEVEDDWEKKKENEKEEEVSKREGRNAKPFFGYPSPAGPNDRRLHRSAVTPSPRRSGASLPSSSPFPTTTTHLVVPPQRARWYWSGDDGSHFSRVIQRSGGAGGLLLKWDDQRLYDPRTACWYSTGSCKAAAAAAAGDVVEDHYAGVAQYQCLLWERPSVVRILRAGIYKVTACLVSRSGSSLLCSEVNQDSLSPAFHCTRAGVPATAAATVSVYVDGYPIAHMRASSTHILLHATSGDDDVAIERRRTARSSSRRAHSPSAGVVATAAGGITVRPCCAPAQLSTNTSSDYVYLPSKTALQVRCHNVCNTKAIYEAFLEVEYIA